MKVVSLLDGRFIGATNAPLDEGVSVVALHGWGRSRDDFRHLLEQQGTLALDLPGFGASPPPSQSGGAREYATTVASALEPLAAAHGPVVVIGHSFGGRVGVCLAANRPDLVKGLLLIGVPLLRAEGGGKPALSYRIARRANKLGIYSDKKMDKLRYERGSADYRNAEGVMREVLVRTVNEDYSAELKALTMPTSLLWGVTDTAATLAQAQQGAKLITPLVEFRTIADADHDVHLSHPHDVASMARDLREKTAP